MASRFRLLCEYNGARLGLALVRVLPPRAACAAARLAGWLAFAFDRRRRRTAVSNLLKTGVAANRREARRIAGASFCSIALAVVESLVVPRLLDEGRLPAGAVEVDMPDETRALLSDPEAGAITVSAHYGNWELGAKISSAYKPITAIARRMNNGRVQALMDRAKVRDGFETIDKHDSNPLKIVRVLKRHRVLAVLTDQHAHGGSACTIEFFGLPASTYTTPAVLQRLTGVPILLCVVTRVGTLRFRVEYSKPIRYAYGRETSGADVAAATQDIAAQLEAKIREHPEQYLWAHNRWRAAPPAARQGRGAGEAG